MTWLGFKNNKSRPDKGANETERTVWLPVLKPYLEQIQDDDDFVDI